MNKWDELRKECYGKDTLERYQNGRIDFSPDSMQDVENGDFKSYDEYLEVQKRPATRSGNFSSCATITFQAHPLTLKARFYGSISRKTKYFSNVSW